MKEQSSVATIVDALGLAPSGELVAIVGGGGKSSLMFELAQRLPGRGPMAEMAPFMAVQWRPASDGGVSVFGFCQRETLDDQ